MKFDKENFIKKANLKHNYKYKYELLEFVNSNTKVKIICPNHGIFEQTASGHLSNNGCYQCGKESSNDKLRMSLDEFIYRSNMIHNYKYDYSKVVYAQSKIKVLIICNICKDEFWQEPDTHVRGSGCPKCKGVKKLTLENFIKRANEKHNNIYNYSLVEYKNNYTKIIIICKEHGKFLQLPNGHLTGRSCPQCNLSKAEQKIEKYLKDNNIKYISQYKFLDCKNIYPLPFDFYLPEYKLAIEYDGIQHFEIFQAKWNNDAERLRKTQLNDGIKTKYCENNNINLLRIKYTEFDKIDNVLQDNIKV